MTFGGAVVAGFRRYVGVAGRANRAEFWYFYAFVLLADFFMTFVTSAGAPLNIARVVFIILLIPCVTVGIRRLHDTGRSGHWHWLALTLVGYIVLWIFWAQPSKPVTESQGPVLDAFPTS